MGRARVFLHDRRTSEPNFAHCVRLLGSCGAWAESLPEGHVITHNDLNMIQIPVEVALALLRDRLGDGSEIGAAASAAFDMLTAFRVVEDRD